MSNILQERKFILAEHKIMLEALSKDNIKAARTKIEQILKEETSNSNIGLVDAYNKYKRILNDTNTTANDTSDLTRVNNAFKEFWTTIFNSDYYKDTIDPTNMTGAAGTKFFNDNKSLVKNAKKLIGTTDLVGTSEYNIPDVDGKEINKKLLLRAANATEEAFSDAALSWKTDSSNAVITAYLKFIVQSLLIFENSFDNLTSVNYKKLLEDIINLISNTSTADLHKQAVLSPIVKALQSLNKTIASAQHTRDNTINKKAKDRLTTNNGEYWSKLSKEMSDADFWNKYYTEYWGTNAETVRGLGATFKEECKVYGYTEDRNKFIFYIRHFLLAYRVRFNSAQYNEVHNAVARRDVYLNELANVKSRSIIWCIDLFSKSPKEMKDYIELDSTFAMAAPQYRAAWMYAEYNNNSVINSKLNTLDTIRYKGADVLEGKGAPMDVNRLDAVLATVTTSLKNNAELLATMLILSYLDAKNQAIYYEKYNNAGIDLSNYQVTPLELTKARNELQKHGIPDQKTAITLLDKLLAKINEAKKANNTGA